MTGAFEMFQKVLLLSSLCTVVRSSGLEHVGQISPIAPIDTAPIVTAASSQYFERTFNRLVVPQVAPVAPVVPAAVQPVIPVAPNPTVLLEPDRTVPVAVNPQPNPEATDQPNVAIAIATAHAAAPVATILLPPYPFGFPPTVRFIPEQPVNTADENNKEPTTQSTTQAEVTRTIQEPKSTTPIPSNSDDNFVQALPSNEDVNFKQYGSPPQSRPQYQPIPQPQQPRPQPQPNQPRPEFQLRPQQPYAQFQPNQQQFRPTFSLPPQQPFPQFKSLPQPPQPHSQYQPIMRPQLQPKPQPWPQNVAKPKPQKLKTSVQVVPVPLAYIAPPSAQYRHGHHHHGHVKVVKHIYSFIPVSKSKIILKELPVRLVAYKTTGNAKANIKDIEFTTVRPFPPRPNTKPPRLW